MGSLSLPLLYVDAFTERAFAGNPAAVVLLRRGQALADHVMQSIAAEMNLSETAFVHELPEGGSLESGARFGLRWFTPTTEVPLCGHATLASAKALAVGAGNASARIEFETLSGVLVACVQGEGYIALDLPLNSCAAVDNVAKYEPIIKAVVGDLPVAEVELSVGAKKLLVRLPDEVSRERLESLSPNYAAMMAADNFGVVKGVIVTIAGKAPHDFFSRYFAPWNGIPEDPVTGSAHTVLVGYWSRRLGGKTSMLARQCSPRGGDLRLSLDGCADGRVLVAGRAAVIVEGKLHVPQ